jgi:alcohol dehydrogenase class IV
MIDTFSFTPFPQIFFGEGEFKKLAARLSKKCRKALIVCGGKSLQESGLLTSFKNELSNSQIEHRVVNINSEPSPETIDKIVNDARTFAADTVIAVGGGSVLDAGKAIAAMLPLKDSIIHYLEGIGDKNHPGSTLPFIAVPTTSGTGSEATKNAVITLVGEEGFKKSLRHDNFIPNIAVIDPQLMLTCPEDLTAACGLDTITQLLESYVSIKANPISDALALSALQKVFTSFPVAVNHGNNDLNARADMAYGALISGITLANAGLGVVHGFASSIGGFFDIPHGVVCGSLLPIATETNIKKLSESSDQKHKTLLEKHIKVARLFPATTTLSDVQALQFMIDQFHQWIEMFSIPRFNHYGVTEKDIERIIKTTGIKNNPVPLNSDDLKFILLNRI